MAKDPVCGMIVNEETGLSSEVGRRLFYFCSPMCKQTFVQSEKELAKMKKRMYVAVSGALVLAIVRAALYLSVAAAAMALSSISVIANSALLKRYDITSGEEKLFLKKSKREFISMG